MATVNAVDESSAEPDELTRRMIDIGGRMLAEHGMEGLSLRKLAAAAGTSTMSVYSRFGSKQALLAAMYREGFRRLGVALADQTAVPDDLGVPGPLQEMAGTGLAYRRAALASPTLYGLMFGAVAPGLQPSAEDDTAAAATYEPLRSGCRRAVDAGVLHGDADRIALHLWAVAHGMVSLELAGRLAPVRDTTDATDAADPEQLYLEALAFSVTPFLAPPS